VRLVAHRLDEHTPRAVAPDITYDAAMRWTGLLVVAMLAMAAVAPAAADDGARPVSGFVMEHGGELRGRVLDLDGAPLRGVKVHVVERAGAERIVRTDSEGQYRATTRSGALVFVEEQARIDGHCAVAAVADGAEAIEVHEIIPAKAGARPRTDPRAIPPYTDEAKTRNDWRKQWLLLDVDSTGTVQHVMELHAPGLGLDAIGIREAFALRFDPARDHADRPMPSLVVWAWEWPAYWWLDAHEVKTLVPDDAYGLVCRGAGPSTKTYRDCPPLDMAKAATQPWIPRPRP